MKNQAGVGIVRGPDSQAQSHTVRCPLCDWALTLKRVPGSDSISSALFVSTVQWEIAERPADQQTSHLTGPWEKVFEGHVKAHPVAQIIACVYQFENRVATMQATADRLNDFLDALVRFVSTAPTPVLKRDFTSLLVLLSRSSEMIGVTMPEQMQALMDIQ